MAKESQSGPPPTLDLRRGSFGGVAVGDTVRQMHRKFGPKKPAAEGEPATALSVGEDQDYSPPVLAPGGVIGFRYEHVAFMTNGSHVEAIIVNDPEARSKGSGIAIGDELAKARARYRVRCGTANENTEYEPFAACVGRTARGDYVWFGADPIRNITLSRMPPEGI